ncbi:VOC family protein [Alsobacter sp. SYSU BS001988]|jgi:PhnB protein
MSVNPYLFFNGRCEEAFTFYKAVLGAEVKALMRYRDAPEGPPPGMLPPGSENKIMHGEIAIGGSSVMASDGECSGASSFQGFSLSLVVGSEDEAERAFAALSEGGAVRMPMAKTFFAPRFGMLTDKFGVGWMVLAQA